MRPLAYATAAGSIRSSDTANHATSVSRQAGGGEPLRHDDGTAVRIGVPTRAGSRAGRFVPAACRPRVSERSRRPPPPSRPRGTDPTICARPRGGPPPAPVRSTRAPSLRLWLAFRAAALIVSVEVPEAEWGSAYRRLWRREVVTVRCRCVRMRGTPWESRRALKRRGTTAVTVASAIRPPAPGPPVSLAVGGQVGERLGVGANAARITSAVFSAASGASGCPHTTARMKSGPTSRS
jgi:hypothetical protein